MKKIEYINSISFKVKAFILLFSFILIISIYLVFSLFNNQELKQGAFHTTILTAKKVNAQFEQQINRMEMLAITLANLGTTMSNDHKHNRDILKKLLNIQGHENFIAGSGIWPEPYAFDKTKKRNSYFFRRNKEGILDFYNNYNDTKTPDYHNQEWYLPAKYYKEGDVYWSKLYIDPYSLQAMVTATAPMYRDGVFIGVSTVDVILNGLEDFFKNSINEVGVYGFIVDRNNKFLSYPDDKKTKKKNNYITLDKLALQEPRYREVSNILIRYDRKKLTKKYIQIAQELELNSKQIDRNQAKKIALMIKDSDENTVINYKHIKAMMIKDNPITNEKSIAVSIFNPNTYWSLVVMIPSKIILAQSNKIFNNLMIAMILLITLGSIISFHFIKKSIIIPIISMTKQINDNKNYLVESTREDELGLLATWFENKVKELKEESAKNQQKDQQLFRQSRLAQMGEMISMIAHQWRQPLSSISTTSINMQMKLQLETFDLKDKKGQEECSVYFLKRLENINEYVQNLTATINDFRNFYKQNKEAVNIRLENIVIQSLRIIKKSLLSSDIEVIENYNDKSNMWIYDNELMQVILNILKNAQDNFIEKKIKEAKITITIEKNMIFISDNGGGISPELIEKIFDPYFSTKDEKNGTGLGLYMSKIIIERHHSGSLEAYNTQDGVCFKVVLKDVDIYNLNTNL